MKKLFDEILHQIITFWKNLRDFHHGGYYGYVDSKGSIDKYANKGGIITARILWFFSAAYNLLKDEQLLPYAQAAYDFLSTKLWDKEQLGIFWEVDYLGISVDTRKHIYAQAFAIYGLTEYYIASKDKKALQLAKDIFNLIEEKGKDELGYLEEFYRFWQEKPNEMLGYTGINAERTMNTHLHLLEAYTALYRVWKTEDLKKSLTFLINIFKDNIYDNLTHHLQCFFDRNWQSLINIKSFGHDIECSWLLDEACEVLGDESLSQAVQLVTNNLVKSVIEEAYDHNSIINENVNGHLDKTRVWWIQAEAIVGLYNYYQKTKDSLIYSYIQKIVTFIQKYLISPYGEWYWEVDDSYLPELSKELAGFWKCPYHNGRMCIELLRRMDES
ncbi:MAG: N-acylglucosamine 2-epimerase [Bacilli bacterium]|nr:N-acylglucosamine 2-epimerase [Bacilli bacterium]